MENIKQFYTNKTITEKIAGFAAAILALLLIIYLPASGNRSLMNIGIMVLMYIALGQSWNVGAMVGLFSVTHSVFFGLGVYGVTITLNRFGGDVITGVFIGLAMNLIVGIIVGLIASKLSGLYFIMALIGINQIIYAVAVQFPALTGGTQGISMPREMLMSKPSLFFIALVLAMLSMIFYVVLRNSRIGTSFVTTRENPNLSLALGSNVPLWRVVGLCISTCMASLSGAFYAFYMMSNNTDVFSGTFSLKIMTVSIVGGSSSVWGPVMGCIIIILDEYVRGMMPSKYAPFAVIIYALVLIVMALLRPNGLVSFFKKEQRHTERDMKKKKLATEE